MILVDLSSYIITMQVSHQKEFMSSEKLLTSKQFYINWLLIMMTTFNNVAGYSMSISTLYNFVTNSKDQTCGTPGLGESETVYAIAAAMYHGGIVIGAIPSTLLIKTLDYRRLLTIGPLLQVIGGFLYATSTSGWMIILSRCFIGANYGLGMSINMSYLTYSARQYYQKNDSLVVELNNTSRANKLKKKLMITYGLITYISYLPASGFVSLVSRFANINQFRWIGWFQASCSATLVLLILYSFTNSYDDLPPKVKVIVTDTKKSPIKWQTIAVIMYLIITGYTVDSIITVLDTMISLVLSEYFGFSAEYISHFVTGVLVLAPCSPMIMLIAQKIGISSRLLLLIGLIISTAGLICIGDWQSIFYDKCNTNITIDYNNNDSIQYECSSQSMDCTNIADIGRDCLLFSNDSSAQQVTIYYYKMTFMWEQTSSDCPLCNNNNDCIEFHFSDNLLCIVTDTNLTSSPGNNQVYITGLNNSICLSSHHQLASNNCSTQQRTTAMEGLITVMNGLIDNTKEQKYCESDGECYWNQQSLITGSYCTDCTPICRSRKGSLSFPQFCVGAILTIIALGMGRSIMFPILTKTSPPHLQELTTSLLVLVGAISSFVTPIWTTTLYISSDRTTFKPIAIMVLCQVPIYIGFCIFYKQLTTTTKRDTNSTNYYKKNSRGDRPSVSSIIPIINDPMATDQAETNDCNLSHPNSLTDCFPMPPHIKIEDDIHHTSDEYSSQTLTTNTALPEIVDLTSFSIFETPL